jgi:hypothetical protein
VNICIIAASENNKISDSDPNDYLPQLMTNLGPSADDVFQSNFLPIPKETDYAKQDFTAFLDKRAPILHDLITGLCDGN